jgi:hypothetical protein
MFDRSIAVIVPSAGNIRVVWLRGNIGRSIVCWLRQTNECEGFSLVYLPRRSDAAVSSSWRGSRECIATPWRWASTATRSWRASAGRWTVHTAEERGQLLGYITYRISNGWGLVGGLLALPERLDIVESLLQETMRSLHRQGIAAIQSWSTPRHPYRDVLRKLGVEKKRRTVILMINAADEEFTLLEDPSAAVHIVAGDTDLV